MHTRTVCKLCLSCLGFGYCLSPVQAQSYTTIQQSAFLVLCSSKYTWHWASDQIVIEGWVYSRLDRAVSITLQIVQANLVMSSITLMIYINALSYKIMWYHIYNNNPSCGSLPSSSKSTWVPIDSVRQKYNNTTFQDKLCANHKNSSWHFEERQKKTFPHFNTKSNWNKGVPKVTFLTCSCIKLTFVVNRRFISEINFNASKLPTYYFNRWREELYKPSSALSFSAVFWISPNVGKSHMMPQ